MYIEDRLWSQHKKPYFQVKLLATTYDAVIINVL